MIGIRHAWVMLAVLSLAACGGGSDAPLAAATTGVNAQGTGNNTGTNTGTNTGSNTGSNTGGTSTGAMLKLVAGQVLISGTAFNLAQYQSTDGVGPAARSDFSPMLSFGFRPQANNRPTATGTVVHTPLLLSMKQRAADVLPGEQPQIFQFVFPNVDMVISADHDVVGVSFPAGAKAWAYYSDPWKEVVVGSSSLVTNDLISLQPIADDSTSDLLSFSIDPLMRDIINNSPPADHSIWNGVAPMHGTFDTSIVIGNTTMETDAFVPLPTASISFAGTSAGIPAVSGAVLTGGVKVAPD